MHRLETIILKNEVFSTKYIFPQKLKFVNEMRGLVGATTAFSFFIVAQQIQSYTLKPDDLSFRNLNLNFCFMEYIVHIHFNTNGSSLIIYSSNAENSLRVFRFASILQLTF